MQDIRALRPPLGFPADHLGDLGLVEVRGLAGLRKDLAAFPQDHERDRVRLLVPRGELGPEGGLEGQGPQPPPRADIAARSWLRTSSFSVASTSFASLGW